MMLVPEEVIRFFERQGFVVVSTLDRGKTIHNSCKGIIQFKKNGKVYLFDLYRGVTFDNLKRNSKISITAVDEHKFKGYCLKGSAKIVSVEKLEKNILKVWEDRMTGRIAQRLIKNIKEEKGHPHHPESLLPKPKYMIAMEVKAIIDLTPHHIKQTIR